MKYNFLFFILLVWLPIAGFTQETIAGIDAKIQELTEWSKNYKEKTFPEIIKSNKAGADLIFEFRIKDIPEKQRVEKDKKGKLTAYGEAVAERNLAYAKAESINLNDDNNYKSVQEDISILKAYRTKLEAEINEINQKRTMKGDMNYSGDNFVSPSGYYYWYSWGKLIPNEKYQMSGYNLSEYKESKITPEYREDINEIYKSAWNDNELEGYEYISLAAGFNHYSEPFLIYYKTKDNEVLYIKNNSSDDFGVKTIKKVINKNFTVVFNTFSDWKKGFAEKRKFMAKFDMWGKGFDSWTPYQVNQAGYGNLIMLHNQNNSYITEVYNNGQLIIVMKGTGNDVGFEISALQVLKDMGY
ncbi:MAG: hypothetical protein LBG72_05605 [Spirochaetaceae bacterium]|nr:hypothetical protein [Spirochaetaceae bacterium]